MTQAISSYPQFAFHLVTNALNAFTIYDFFDDGIADILGLQTYGHGTAPKCNYSILWKGADPRFGGSDKLGEGAGEKAVGKSRPEFENWDSTGKFYVGPDTGGEPSCIENVGCLSVPGNFLLRKQMLRMYATQATLGVSHADGCGMASCPAGFFLSTFSPSIKFRFTPEEARAQDFQDDTTAKGGMAAYTMKPITPDHIGLYGTLTHGLQGNICERIQNDPWRFAAGVVKIAIAVTLIAAAVFGIAYAPALITFWLMWDAAVCVGRIAVPLIFGTLSTIEDPV